MSTTGISIVMNGIRKCSGSCLYCSAASTMNYRAKDNQTSFIFNKEKTKKTILEYCKTVLEQDRKKGEGTTINIDIWGGNPVENFKPFKEVVAFCENDLKEFKIVKLHTSGNGLELQSRDIVDFLINHNIHYQLSHDGLGQWLRTGEIDPLYWDKTKDNIAELTKKGILDWINCSLTARNPSFFDNIDYWNKWRKEINLDNKIDLTIKLNHIYDGTPPIEKKWTGKDNAQIKNGEIIGDLNLHGETLQEYLHEFRKLALICHTPGVREGWEFKPFCNYIFGQTGRFKIYKDENELGSCTKFQRGITKTNFAIDTKGNYCQCNLIDSDGKVKNEKAQMPDYCKGCIYEKTLECNTCGSENFPEKCEYKWWWNKTLEETFQMIQLIDAYENLLKNNNTHQCNCNKPDEPVFCVKGYRL